VRFQNFQCRKFNVNYVKKEIAWYLRGDKFDKSICDHAKLWRDIVNEDGSINSNYGQYIFFGKDNQFDNVVKILSSDKDSRRASIVILNSSHLLSNTKDVPCTCSLNFRIRNDVLNMSVHMRSQDAIFGMGNDAPAFSVIHEMVLNALRRTYPSLAYGNYFHIADSFHVYERHFNMLEQIQDGNKYQRIICPEISGPDEVDFLRKCDYSEIPEQFEFTKWLTE
jgi:thymidylate synthase